MSNTSFDPNHDDAQNAAKARLPNVFGHIGQPVFTYHRRSSACRPLIITRPDGKPVAG